MNLKKNIAGILLTSVVCVSAGNLSVTKGTVTVTGEDSSFSVTESATIIEGDNLYIHKGADAALFDKSGKAALMFKEKSECVLLKSDKQTFSVKLTAGEALLKEEGTAKSSIKSGGCTVTPVGTAGAVKVKPDGSPKVGVLEGSMNFTSPDGKSINITGGSFASFNKQNKTFTPVQELPESALESLKEFAGNIPDTPPQPEPREKKDKPESEQSAQNVDTDKETTPAPDELTGTEETVEQEEQEIGDPAKETEQTASAPLSEEQDKDVDEDQDIAVKEESGADREGDIPPESKEDESGEDIEEETAQESGGDETPSAAATTGEADADEADAGEADADEADAGEADADEADAGEATAGEADADEDKEGEEGFEADKPTGGISAGMVTVDGEQWTRIALFADIPIWRFGIGLDLELFLDQQGAPSSKGWSFSKDNWAEAVFRKIRYLRFNHEGDPVYIRFGGLESVTLGYGIIMKEFTNMLYYPDEKLLGLRFDLNDISPLGISIQTVIADFHDFNNESGILGGRLGFKPFKPSGVPLLENLEIAGMGVLDVNQYGPARDWDYSLEGSKYDRDQDGITDSAFTTSLFDTIDHTLSAEEKNRLREADLFDTNIEHKDRWASRSHNSFSIVGGDGSLPLIQSKIFDLTLYGQAAIIYDKLFEDKDKRDRGWGVGAPGLLAGIGPLNLQVEYRHTDGHFHFSYFDKYYLAERITRNPEVVIKEDRLSYNDLNGVYGEAGMDIAGIFHLRANYQYLFGDSITRDYYFQDTIRDVPLKDTEQKLEATASIGQKVIERIPKLNRAEIFFDKTNIQNTVIKYGKEENQDGGGFLYTLTYDGLFDKTRFMHWGYRIGIEMTEGTSITWETRHGWKRPEDIKPGEKIELIEDNSISIQAGMSF